MGIDQSFTCSGVVVTDGAEILHFETIKTSKTDDIFTRASSIAAALVDIARRWGCTHANIEGLSFGSVGNVTRNLAGLQYVVVTQLMAAGLTVDVIPPQTVKKFATINGRADKAAMIAALPLNVFQMFSATGYKKSTGLADLADAYYLANIGIA